MSNLTNAILALEVPTPASDGSAYAKNYQLGFTTGVAAGLASAARLVDTLEDVQATAAQFVAEYFNLSDLPVVEHDELASRPTWEEYVAMINAAGLTLGRLVAGKRFEDWYGILERCVRCWHDRLVDCNDEPYDVITVESFEAIIARGIKDAEPKPATLLDAAKAVLATVDQKTQEAGPYADLLRLVEAADKKAARV